MLVIVNLFARIIDKFKLSVYKMENHKRGCREYVKNKSNRQVTDVFFIIWCAWRDSNPRSSGS